MQGEEGKTAERPTRARLHDSTAGGIGIGPWPKNFPFCIALPWIKWPPAKRGKTPDGLGLAWRRWSWRLLGFLLRSNWGVREKAKWPLAEPIVRQSDPACPDLELQPDSLPCHRTSENRTAGTPAGRPGLPGQPPRPAIHPRLAESPSQCYSMMALRVDERSEPRGRGHNDGGGVSATCCRFLVSVAATGLVGPALVCT